MAKTRWEYIISTDRESLSALGLEGWELVGVTVVEGKESFYFKRPCPSIREEITLAQRDNVMRQKGADSQ